MSCLWEGSWIITDRIQEFFPLSLSRVDLEELYKSMNLLRYRYKYSGETIDSMMPWEIGLELDMIAMELQKEQKQRENFG